MTEVAELELFKDLTYITQDGKEYDLHNDYNCSNLNYDKESKSLSLLFEQVNNELSLKLCLIFKEVIIAKFNLLFSFSTDVKTVNNFYRGKFEENGQLIEFSSEGQGYFYLEFENGNKFEFFSKSMVIMEI